MRPITVTLPVTVTVRVAIGLVSIGWMADGRAILVACCTRLGSWVRLHCITNTAMLLRERLTNQGMLLQVTTRGMLLPQGTSPGMLLQRVTTSDMLHPQGTSRVMLLQQLMSQGIQLGRLM